jgi:ribosomal-protein-alanine acetyltransferase
MMNLSDFTVELLKKNSPDDIFRQLSELDILCVGSDGWSENSFRSEVEKGNGIVLYISSESSVIALISGYFAVGEGDITSVAVHPDYRRRGLAQKLICEFEKKLPKPTESIFLEVRESNAAATELYKKCGFEPLSVRKNFYVKPQENAVVMRKIFAKKDDDD